MGQFLPVPFPVSLPDTIGRRLKHDLPPQHRSVSAFIRHALDAYPMAGHTPSIPQLQISLRLRPDQLALLRRTARRKRVSEGELIRAAIKHSLP